ncbi:hypothetical protein HBI42_206250 [Parastagonospora nodorum]|nr:hypothetical protein HBI12_068560 [Parastagonospora nodorum]KAH5707352.1 hypothetical protein HBI20_205150 [Parastagonospora nodorum]KAH6244263.1 hypothetical protein HBI42_206250 [Parastagonospora nodorum]
MACVSIGEANPDIAGIGILVAFATQSLVAVFVFCYTYLLTQIIWWRRECASEGSLFAPEDPNKRWMMEQYQTSSKFLIVPQIWNTHTDSFQNPSSRALLKLGFPLPRQQLRTIRLSKGPNRESVRVISPAVQKSKHDGTLLHKKKICFHVATMLCGNSVERRRAPLLCDIGTPAEVVSGATSLEISDWKLTDEVCRAYTHVRSMIGWSMCSTSMRRTVDSILQALGRIAGFNESRRFARSARHITAGEDDRVNSAILEVTASCCRCCRALLYFLKPRYSKISQYESVLIDEYVGWLEVMVTSYRLEIQAHCEGTLRGQREQEVVFMSRFFRYEWQDHIIVQYSRHYASRKDRRSELPLLVVELVCKRIVVEK